MHSFVSNQLTPRNIWHFNVVHLWNSLPSILFFFSGYFQCGQELGETLLNLSRAWEQADTSSSSTLVSKLPSLAGSLTNNAKTGKNSCRYSLVFTFPFLVFLLKPIFILLTELAFGKRLVSAGRRFQSMGQYGQGELQRVSILCIPHCHQKL